MSRYVGNGAVNYTDASGLTRYPAQGNPALLYLNQRQDIRTMMNLMTVSGSDSSGDWLDNSANLAAGFGDGLTIGGTDYIRNYYGINDGIDHDSGLYVGGSYAGTAYSFTLGFGAGANTARGGVWAIRGLKGYVWASDAAGVAESGYHVYNGDFKLQHTLGFIPLAGYGFGRLRGLNKLDDIPTGSKPKCFTAGHEVLVDLELDHQLNHQKILTAGISGIDDLPKWVQATLMALGGMAAVGMALTPREKRKLLAAEFSGFVAGFDFPQLEPDWDSGFTDNHLRLLDSLSFCTIGGDDE